MDVTEISVEMRARLRSARGGIAALPEHAIGQRKHAEARRISLVWLVDGDEAPR